MLQHACVFAMNSKQLMQCKPINFETNHYVDTLDMCVHMAKLQCEQKKKLRTYFGCMFAHLFSVLCSYNHLDRVIVCVCMGACGNE